MNFCNKFGVKNLLYHRWKDLHWKSKVSLYIIWYVFGLRAGEIWTKSYGQKYKKFCLFWQKTGFFKSYFWQRIDAILEDVSGDEAVVECLTINFKTTIFHHSKYYGSPTRVTKLKVASNMADPISFKISDSTLKIMSLF